VSFSELRGELIDVFSRGVSEPLSADAFNDLALRVFRYQAASVSAYAAYLERRGLDPGSVNRWEDVPFLPARAFKAAALVSGACGVERVFRTSGTTGGEMARGEHHIRDLSLYRSSLLPNFKAHLFPGGESLPLLCLLPSPEAAMDSSLSYMMGEVGRGTGVDARFFAGPNGGLQLEEFCEALYAASAVGDPVLVAGTAFAFVQMLEWFSRGGLAIRLPSGSRIMETGGYKGRTRVVAREDLCTALQETLGVPLDYIVNEYGMTEMLSQFYEPVLVGGVGSMDGSTAKGNLGERYHRGPPWVGTLVLDPLSLESVPVGAVGILAHFDLANLGSVAAILTEDLGRAISGGFQLMGRSLGAEPRGCSLAMEDFLASISERS
jgi:hypothetical protein